MRYLFVLLTLLAGCSATNWAKEGTTKADLDSDYRECATEASPGKATLYAFGGVGVAARMGETNEKIRACMRARGWQAQN
jgi:hypothetical protein